VPREGRGGGWPDSCRAGAGHLGWAAAPAACGGAAPWAQCALAAWLPAAMLPPTPLNAPPPPALPLQAYKKLITEKDQVDGLPATALGLAAQQAAKEVGAEQGGRSTPAGPSTPWPQRRVRARGGGGGAAVGGGAGGGGGPPGGGPPPLGHPRGGRARGGGGGRPLCMHCARAPVHPASSGQPGCKPPRVCAPPGACTQGHEGASADAGPWLFTLDFPSYYPVMTHAKNRALREEMYRWASARGRGGGGLLPTAALLEQASSSKLRAPPVAASHSHSPTTCILPVSVQGLHHARLLGRH